jgi:hypothetical protein
MSVLQLYRGPRLQLRYMRRQGSPNAVSLFVDQTMVMLAQPSDFIELQKWLANEAEALKTFMREPEDPTVAENQRGDVP